MQTKLQLIFGSGLFGLLLLGCIPIYERLASEDLPEIRKRGKLKVITAYNANSYFIYRGQPMGYEYELVKMLADHLGLELEMIITQNMDNIPYQLNSGDGDLVAASIAVTGERVRQVQFTEPLMLTRQVLVQRATGYDPMHPVNQAAVQDTGLDRSAVPEQEKLKQKENQSDQNSEQVGTLEQANILEGAASVLAGELHHGPRLVQHRGIVRDPIQLLGKQVHVRKASPFYQRLRHLEKEVGGQINIVTVPGDVITEDLIRMVHSGKIEYTIADEPTALINKAYYTGLDVSTPISFSQRIAWVVRPNAPELLKEINKWISSMKQKQTLAIVYRRYFLNPRDFRARVSSEFYSEKGDRISVYDEKIKAAAEHIDWDWRLLAALAFQESRFNPNARSWAGAGGLMQLMPGTAAGLGVSNVFNPEQNISGGARYLQTLEKRWQGKIKNPEERIKFILASYNAGPGHVEDAQSLANYFGKDPLLWDENVAQYMLKLSDPQYYNRSEVRYGYCRGEEPFHYVKEILERYDNYKKFFTK